MSSHLKPEERTRCERWTRVMGYHRPVSSFNKGKQQEHADRKQFRERYYDCECGDFKENGSSINVDAWQCANCGGWKSGLEIWLEEKKP